MVGALLTAASALAIPANSLPRVFNQPSGSTVTLQLHGDEYYDFLATTDGYTVLKNEAGAYVYAMRDGEGLKASGIVAHDADNRQPAEVAFLAGTQRFLTSASAMKARSERIQRENTAPKKLFNYPKFKGLIILVEFQDVQFSTSEAHDLWWNIANTKGFTEYKDASGNVISGTTFDGSVRDYYYDNSLGKFDPVFDVIGPIQVNHKSTEGRKNSTAIFRDALALAAKSNDFSKYDTNGDGYADMVFFLVAGHGSNVAGNDENLLWPYKSSGLQTSLVGGTRFNLFACSTEMGGYSYQDMIDGIGTICHEFTHVLGLPDFYDTDYEKNGTSHHPGEWDIMAGGGYLNGARTPAGYTEWQRNALGFHQPTVITEPGHYELNPHNETSDAFIIKSPEDRVYFMLENRHNSKWDKYLPGHGLTIIRVDSTNVNIWRNGSSINTNPEHNYYEMLRAGNTTSGDLDSDTYPGKLGVISCNTYTRPSMVTYNGAYCKLGLYNIAESTDGIISFDVKNEDNVTKLFEGCERMKVTTETSTAGVKGSFATWDLNKCSVVEPTEGDFGGARAIAMKNPSQMTMTTPIHVNGTMVQVGVHNPTNTIAKFILYQSTDGGTTWAKVPNSKNVTTVELPKNASMTYEWPLRFKKTDDMLLRLVMTAGNKNTPCLIDDICVFYNIDDDTPIGDVNYDGKVDVKDLNILTNIVLGYDTASKYDGRADINGDGKTDVVDINMTINIILGL